jgi:predicted DNA-binding protein (MmcQ/YjbR family)
MAEKKLKSDAVVLALREFGLAYPGAHTKSPWPGHADLAVRDKTFAYLSTPGEAFSISCKLPESSHTALALPFAAPTAWGLGKSGWVTATFTEKQSPPLELFKSWIDESYRAQAPKKLVAQMDAHAGTAAAKAAGKSHAAKRSAKAAAAKKAAAAAAKTKRKAAGKRKSTRARQAAR